MRSTSWRVESASISSCDRIFSWGGGFSGTDSTLGDGTAFFFDSPMRCKITRSFTNAKFFAQFFDGFFPTRRWKIFDNEINVCVACRRFLPRLFLNILDEFQPRFCVQPSKVKCGARDFREPGILSESERVASARQFHGATTRRDFR